MKRGSRVPQDAKQVSSVVQEFTRFAHQYDKYNIIQVQVAKYLVEMLDLKYYKSVLDLGSGSGEIFKNFRKQAIETELFVALDSAKTMLKLHPDEKEIVKINSNFNHSEFLTALPHKKYDLLISSSALQWSTNLDFTFSTLSKLSNQFYGAIFTSGTFKSLHIIAGVESPIYSAETIQKYIVKYYKNVDFNLQQYRLEFTNTREMFRYIKQSGVSSGERKLSYKKTKQLMREYTLDYLEFEVLFVKAKH